MKVTYNMIEKELRIPGILIKLILNKSNVKKFIKTSKFLMKLSYKRHDIKGLLINEEWITRKDGSKMRILIHRPPQSLSNLPGILWMHGGGYMFGDPESGSIIYKELIQRNNCILISIDYRLAAEAPYPAALEDCYEALLWMKTNAKKLGIRDDQLMIGGDSAGGGLTAALSLYARDKGEVNISFQMPLYPMIDDRMNSESAKENNAPVWDSKKNRWGWEMYLGELFGKDVPAYAAAARATDYTNLPPTFTFVGDLDPFRDETIQYVENLKNAGVKVHFQIYKGCYHAFNSLLPKLKVSEKANTFMMEIFGYAVENYFVEQNHEE